MSAVARRYARALFALAKEAHSLDAAADQLAQLAAVATDPAAGPVLSSPLLSSARRHDIVQALTRELALSDLVSHFLALLADHQRLRELSSIHLHFRDLLDDERGRVRITVRSAQALDAPQQDAVVRAFSNITGKQVVPHIAVAAELLGGVVVEVGGKVYDGSVRTQLDRLARALAGTAAL